MRTLAKVGLIGWNGLMAVWFVSWMVEIGGHNDCVTSSFRASCESGRNAGIGLGFMVLLVVAAAGNVVLGVLWMVGRPSARPCPVCGTPVVTGTTRCTSCRHDFRAAAATNGGRWERDPLGRHEFRYWNGRAWTEAVADGGVRALDPVS